MTKKISLVLSGGVALGAYQAGAYAAMHEREDLWPQRIAASSVGAVNAALIAGSAPEDRVQKLREFWQEAQLDFSHPGWLNGARHAYSWLSALQSRLFGHFGQFRPRFPEIVLANVDSMYDLAPLRRQLERFVDFERLNSGALRVSVVTTDIESGDEVVFDTYAGARIEADHLLATCGFLPDFPPLEIGGRLLGDGGLVANAPVENALLDEESNADLVCFVVDLFSACGARPETLEQAAARRWDLIFGNQTRRALRSLAREYRFRPRHPKVKVLHLAYRAPLHEAGPEKPFDFSRASLSERWQAGYLDMKDAIALACGTVASSARSVAMQIW